MMKRTIKFIAAETLTAGVTKVAQIGMAAGLVLSLGMASASAETTLQRTPRRTVAPTPTVQIIPSGVNQLAPQLSLTGEWSGNMHSAGDDVLIQYELSIQSGGGGTWQMIGAEYNANTDTWTPVVLDDGTLSSTVQGTDITIQLFGGNQPMTLDGQFQNGGMTISGQVVPSNNVVFSFSKG
jgi:hypothetical protein